MVDDGEAPDNNEPEMGRTGGVEGWRDGLAGGGVALHNEAC